MITPQQAVESLRERLHRAFIYGCHLTASSPIVIQKAPQEFPWEAFKNELLQGDDLTHNQDGTVNPNKRHTIETCLDNMIRDMKIRQESSSSQNSRDEYEKIARLVMPVARKMLPGLIAFETIGVQPMKGPVDRIHTLRVRYPDDKLEPLTPPKEVPSEVADIENRIKELTAEFDRLTGNEKLKPELEAKQGNRLSIQIIKEVVEAKTRKLSARWLSQTQDIRHLDYEQMVAALAQEIRAEIDDELLSYMDGIIGEASTTYAVFDQASIAGPATFVGDVHAALAILINRQANLIAARSRRGAGNWCIVSPTALAILQSATTDAFARTVEGSNSLPNIPATAKFVGTLNNAMRVYCNQYAPDNASVLVGYKGNDIDASMFWCPYVPITSSGTIIDPNTFEPVTAFMTRYDFLPMPHSELSLANTTDYLGKVGINTDSLSFI